MLPNCPPKMSHFEQQEEVPILTRGLNGFSSASFPEKQWKGLDMLLHGAETLNEIVTVPFNREVLLSDLEGPLANLHWNFYYKDNLSVFSLHPYLCSLLRTLLVTSLSRCYVWSGFLLKRNGHI